MQILVSDGRYRESRVATARTEMHRGTSERDRERERSHGKRDTRTGDGVVDAEYVESAVVSTRGGHVFVGAGAGGRRRRRSGRRSSGTRGLPAACRGSGDRGCTSTGGCDSRARRTSNSGVSSAATGGEVRRGSDCLGGVDEGADTPGDVLAVGLRVVLRGNGAAVCSSDGKARRPQDVLRFGGGRELVEVDGRVRGYLRNE